MNFDLSKENIQPLRGGRNAHQLSIALQAQSNEEYQRELQNQREKFENAIRSYEGDDPLENWYQYVSWVEQSYPKHGPEGNLQPLLEDCISKFEHMDHYKNDRRLCKIFIKYFDLSPNPLELYQMLYAKRMFVGCTDMYKAWAFYHEAALDFQSADHVYKLGKSELAQPHDELVEAYRNMIYSAGQQVVLGPSVYLSKLEERRHALISLQSYSGNQVGSVRVPNQRASNTFSSMGPSGTTKSNEQVRVYNDFGEESFANAAAAPASIVTVAKSQEAPKENVMKPGTWIFAYPQRKAQPHKVPGFQVHDDFEAVPEGLRLPKNFATKVEEDFSLWKSSLIYAEPADPSHVPKYPKDKVYAQLEENIEYSIEEIKARKYLRKKDSRLSVPQQETQDAVLSILGDSNKDMQSSSEMIDEGAVGYDFPEQMYEMKQNEIQPQNHNQYMYHQQFEMHQPHNNVSHHQSLMQHHQVGQHEQSHGSNLHHSYNQMPVNHTQMPLNHTQMQQHHNSFQHQNTMLLHHQQSPHTSQQQLLHTPPQHASQQHSLHTSQQHSLHTSQQHSLHTSQQHSLHTSQQHSLHTSQQPSLHTSQQHSLHTPPQQHSLHNSQQSTLNISQQHMQQQYHPNVSHHYPVLSPIQPHHSYQQPFAQVNSPKQQKSFNEGDISADMGTLWASSEENTSINVVPVVPKQPTTHFTIFEESSVGLYKPKGNAMKTPLKIISHDDIVETGSRGGLDNAGAAQPGDEAKRLSLFEDDSNSYENNVGNYVDLNTTDTMAFNFNLNKMKVSTPVHNKFANPSTEDYVTEEQLKSTKKQLSVIFEETKSSGSSSSSTGLRMQSMPAISEEESRYQFNLAQNMKANAALRSSLMGEIMECETEPNSPVLELPPVTPIDYVPQNPFDRDLINTLLHRVDFPNRHKSSYIFIHNLPRLVVKKEPVEIGRGNYIIDKQIGKGTFGTVFKAVDVSIRKPVAVKCQKPPNTWEYYICKELQQRLSKHPFRNCFMDVQTGYFSDSMSIFISEFSQYGSLLDLANKSKQKTRKPMRESWCTFFCTEMINVVEAMHQVKIIHADIKPDNFLIFVRDNKVQLQLIDFGCSIDMSLLPENATFTKKVTTEDFICCEMRDGRPWSYHTDYYCIGATAHVLLFDKYIQLQKTDGHWSLTQRFARYHHVDLWNTFFNALLNMQEGLPDLESLKTVLSGVQATSADLRELMYLVMDR